MSIAATLSGDATSIASGAGGRYPGALYPAFGLRNASAASLWSATRGNMEVCIDAACQVVSNYSPSFQIQQPISFGGLPDTVHTVTIRKLPGLYLDLDAVDIGEVVAGATADTALAASLALPADCLHDATYWQTHADLTATGFNPNWLVLAEASTLVDQAATDPLIYEAQQIVFGGHYSIPLGFQTGYAAYSSKVHDFGGMFWWMNLVTERNNTWIGE